MQMSIIRRGTNRGGCGGVSGIQTPYLSRIILQIPGEGSHGRGCYWEVLISNMRKTSEAVGLNVSDPGAGGGKCAGLRPVLQGFGPSRPDIWVVEVGHDDQNSLDPWISPPQGDLPDYGVTAVALNWRRVVLTTPGGGYTGGGDGEDRDLQQ